MRDATARTLCVFHKCRVFERTGMHLAERTVRERRGAAALTWNQGCAMTCAMVRRSAGSGRSSRWIRSRTSGEPCSNSAARSVSGAGSPAEHPDDSNDAGARTAARLRGRARKQGGDRVSSVS